MTTKPRKRRRSSALATTCDVGDHVELSRGQTAVILWKGKIESADVQGFRYGIQFTDGSLGRHDGILQAVRYFQGEEERCKFIKSSAIRRRIDRPDSFQLATPPNEKSNGTSKSKGKSKSRTKSKSRRKSKTIEPKKKVHARSVSKPLTRATNQRKSVTIGCRATKATKPKNPPKPKRKERRGTVNETVKVAERKLHKKASSDVSQMRHKVPKKAVISGSRSAGSTVAKKGKLRRKPKPISTRDAKDTKWKPIKYKIDNSPTPFLSERRHYRHKKEAAKTEGLTNLGDGFKSRPEVVYNRQYSRPGYTADALRALENQESTLNEHMLNPSTYLSRPWKDWKHDPNRQPRRTHRKAKTGMPTAKKRKTIDTTVHCAARNELIEFRRRNPIPKSGGKKPIAESGHIGGSRSEGNWKPIDYHYAPSSTNVLDERRHVPHHQQAKKTAGQNLLHEGHKARPQAVYNKEYKVPAYTEDVLKRQTSCDPAYDDPPSNPSSVADLSKMSKRGSSRLKHRRSQPILSDIGDIRGEIGRGDWKPIDFEYQPSGTNILDERSHHSHMRQSEKTKGQTLLQNGLKSRPQSMYAEDYKMPEYEHMAQASNRSILDERLSQSTKHRYISNHEIALQRSTSVGDDDIDSDNSFMSENESDMSSAEFHSSSCESAEEKDEWRPPSYDYQPSATDILSERGHHPHKRQSDKTIGQSLKYDGMKARPEVVFDRDYKMPDYADKMVVSSTNILDEKLIHSKPLLSRPHMSKRTILQMRERNATNPA